jgi:hypothetical protein
MLNHPNSRANRLISQFDARARILHGGRRQLDLLRARKVVVRLNLATLGGERTHVKLNGTSRKADFVARCK